jgi:hypothetical protein
MTAATTTYHPAGVPRRAARWIAAALGLALIGVLGAAVARPAPDAPASTLVGSAPAPGEFRLAPGNLVPPGVVTPVVPATGANAAPGEFRLGPGNAMPPGVVNPAR